MNIKQYFTEKTLYLLIRILVAIFYGLYMIGLLVGLVVNNATNIMLSLGRGRYYTLEVMAFAQNQTWTYFHIFSLGAISILITFFVLTKQPKELFSNEIIYTFGSYLSVVGISLFAYGCMAGTTFEFSSITTLFFGVSLWLSTVLEKYRKISINTSNLLKSAGALSYFLGTTITRYRYFTTVNISPLNSIYSIVIIGKSNTITRSFLPTFPDWIFGGTIWLLFSLYWGVTFLQDKSIIRKTAKTQNTLLTTIAVIYAVELLIFGLFFINFGAMRGSSIIIMFVGSMFGVLAAITILLYLFKVKGWKLWKLKRVKPRQEEIAPPTSTQTT
ncbi:MAG: hypothetical protein ACTSUR_07295 [Candidatus Heimdallarchaeaceae archaeon]